MARVWTQMVCSIVHLSQSQAGLVLRVACVGNRLPTSTIHATIRRNAGGTGAREQTQIRTRESDSPNIWTDWRQPRQPKGVTVLRRTLGLLVLQVTLLLPSGNQIRGSFDVTLMCVTDLSLRLEVRAIVAQSTTQKGYALRPGSLASRQARDRNCDEGQIR